MGLRIKEVIKERGTSVQDLAEKMGISRVGLSQHINGNPSVEVLERIAEALDVEVWELFERQDKDELTALVEYGKNYYKASTVDELEDIIQKIKGISKIPDHENIRGKDYYK